METFQWSSVFETGIAEIDQQHQRLVAILNELGHDVHSTQPDRIEQTLNELASYTVYHFRTEESIMDSHQLAPAYRDQHRDAHRRFVAQVQDWMANRHEQGQLTPRQLLDYLANWLVFHILGDDQSIGRQVAAIRRGQSPETAYAEDSVSEDPRTQILLVALRRLYANLVERNQSLSAAQDSLSQLNAELEQRVQARTAELDRANQRILAEQEHLLESEKMAALGRMVAGFAHEVNTPVGIAVGAVSQVTDSVHSALRQLDQDEVDEQELRQALGTASEAGDLVITNLRRAADLVQSFKRTAVDQTSGNEREFELDEVLTDVIKSMRSAFKATRIQVQCECPPGIRLLGQAGALEQVLVNLLQNSRLHGYADGTGQGTIRIQAALQGNEVVLDYADDGAGMSAATLHQAFEPFFTTRRQSGGTGLGLTIVYSLVTRALGGSVTCQSQPGGGCQFAIRFPARFPGAEE